MRAFVFFTLICCSSVSSAADFGSYIGSIVVKWSDDGRTMTLVEPFAYLDPFGVTWDAPSGSKIDGASIPQFAWSIIGGPFEGKYRSSSVIHDVACDKKERPWDVVHQTFYTGMLASGVSPVKAKIMYAAVYHFGPRWPEDKEIHRDIRITSKSMKCVNEHACAIFDEIPEVNERVEVIKIPPLRKTLTLEEFYRLQMEIEEKEDSDVALTLSQIRDFR